MKDRQTESQREFLAIVKRLQQKKRERFQFRVGQEIRINPAYHIAAWRDLKLEVDRIYRVSATYPESNLVMLMGGVTKHWVPGGLVMPLKTMSFKKWQKLMNSCGGCCEGCRWQKLMEELRKGGC